MTLAGNHKYFPYKKASKSSQQNLYMYQKTTQAKLKRSKILKLHFKLFQKRWHQEHFLSIRSILGLKQEIITFFQAKRHPNDLNEIWTGKHTGIVAVMLHASGHPHRLNFCRTEHNILLRRIYSVLYAWKAQLKLLVLPCKHSSFLFSCS